MNSKRQQLEFRNCRIRGITNKCRHEVEVCRVGTLTHENEVYTSEGTTSGLTGKPLIMRRPSKVRFLERKFFHQGTSRRERTSELRTIQTDILQYGESDKITRIDQERQTTWTSERRLSRDANLLQQSAGSPDSLLHQQARDGHCNSPNDR